jgi:hypothetical protein
MDMSFARRDNSWTKPGKSKINLAVLLAELATRQATTPTALIHAQISNNFSKKENFFSHANLFSGVKNDHNEPESASFNDQMAVLLTNYQ